MGHELYVPGRPVVHPPARRGMVHQLTAMQTLMFEGCPGSVAAWLPRLVTTRRRLLIRPAFAGKDLLTRDFGLEVYEGDPDLLILIAGR